MRHAGAPNAPTNFWAPSRYFTVGRSGLDTS